MARDLRPLKIMSNRALAERLGAQSTNARPGLHGKFRAISFALRVGAIQRPGWGVASD